MKRPDIDAIEERAKASSEIASTRYDRATQKHPIVAADKRGHRSTIGALDGDAINSAEDAAFFGDARTDVLALIEYARDLETALSDAITAIDAKHTEASRDTRHGGATTDGEHHADGMVEGLEFALDALPEIAS